MSRVITGLERIVEEGPAVAGLARGARVGLVAHPASVDRRGLHALELLSAGCGLDVVRVFAPEHGLYGHEQDMEAVDPTRDAGSGLEVVSLYGSEPSTLRPARGRLGDLDAVIVDLQDVGSRYYTFAYTMSHVMEGAAAAGTPVIVLDRPNPIGGLAVEGPVLAPSMASFVGRYPIPVRHGMTIGELAVLFNGAFGIGCALHVVRLAGWRRSMEFESTGLPWVPPSPNMPSPATARVYPGGCLIEGTNLSEGRGTTLPFELAGAPWLDADRLARRLRERALPGVAFRAASFRPMFQKHAGSACAGVQVLVSDPAVFRPFETYLALIVEARRMAPDAFDWRREPYEFETDRLAIDLLLGDPALRAAIEDGARGNELPSIWQKGLDAFAKLRATCLAYSGN